MFVRICLVWVLLAATLHLHAQQRESALSEAEVEKLRDTAAFPAERVQTFITFLDDRTRTIEKVSSAPRKPGREEDIHDLMEQFTSVADDLEDNLDDYGPRHRDLRKVLPKLITAAERWATVLKTPVDNDAYNIARKLALEAVRDIREESTKLLEEQKVWFRDHPPEKDLRGQQPSR
jgi:hypothetical protein